jgi:hypothetical protein
MIRRAGSFRVGGHAEHAIDIPVDENMAQHAVVFPRVWGRLLRDFLGRIMKAKQY